MKTSSKNVLGNSLTIKYVSSSQIPTIWRLLITRHFYADTKLVFSCITIVYNAVDWGIELRQQTMSWGGQDCAIHSFRLTGQHGISVAASGNGFNHLSKIAFFIDIFRVPCFSFLKVHHRTCIWKDRHLKQP